MQTVELIQGTPEWHAFRIGKFTASNAAAMLGLATYKTRSELLYEKATGITPEVDSYTQQLFDKGHQTEAMARPIVENQIGQDVYPVTGVCEIEGLEFLAASFDGLTMCESICWEHKLWNEKIASYIQQNQDLPDSHWPQVEHQLLVSGADSCVFTVSDGTENNKVDLEYKSQPERRQRVIDGWLQFAKDLSVYVPEQKAEKVEAETIRDLPALAFDFDRTSLTIQSNLSAYKQAAIDLVEKSKKPLESDQDFANAESMVKFFKAAEDKLSTVAESVIGQVSDIDRFVKDLKEISESIRSARLNTEKQVKTRKEAIKLEIVSAAQQQLTNHLHATEQRIGFAMPLISADFAGAIKGKKTVQSMKDACSDELAKAKIEIDNTAAVIHKNAGIIQKHGKGLNFLFNDFTQIYLKNHDDFLLLVKSRVSGYEQEQERLKAEEAARLAAEQQKQPEPVQTHQEEVKTTPDSIQEAKQASLGKLADTFERVELNLGFAIDQWANDYAIADDAKEQLQAILASFGVEL